MIFEFRTEKKMKRCEIKYCSIERLLLTVVLDHSLTRGPRIQNPEQKCSKMGKPNKRLKMKRKKDKRK